MSLAAAQMSLFGDEDLPPLEDLDYLTRQLITYIGNKRALGTYIERTVSRVRAELGGRKMTTVDLFSGSGFVARAMKRHSDNIIANDLEYYSQVINTCYLSNRDDVDLTSLREWVDRLNAEADAGANPGGFIQEMYAPADDRHIQEGERAFYTTDNARRIDFFAQAIQEAPTGLRPLLLGPLLSRASVHANTSGVFKGFYKDKTTGIGKFGAVKGDALARILAPIRLELPALSAHRASVTVHGENANALARKLPHADLVYVDPPYNQHPYGSNYFMLNLIATYTRPSCISEVSGIPVDWNRSAYNVKRESLHQMWDLVSHLDADYLLVSFNSEGFISISELKATLATFGPIEEMVVPYNTFRGSRNLRDRDIHVNEHLFLARRH